MIFCLVDLRKGNPNSEDDPESSGMLKAFWWAVLWWCGVLSLVVTMALADYGMREMVNSTSGPQPVGLRGSGEVR